jgi:hypothetical protein
MRAHMEYPRRATPPLARVRQHLSSEQIEDPRGAVSRQLLERGLRKKIRPGTRVAITAGSRGMGAFTELLAGVADAVKTAGGEPFIIPSMGSHGGATPEGQTEILRLLGVTDQSVGAPVQATMDTIPLERSENGAAAHLDRLADAAGGIIVLGRTKTHPESAVGLASGLLKMVVVGLGKQRGAQEAHNHGLWESVRSVPRVTLAKAKILFGVAVVENGYRRPLRIEVVDPFYDAFLESDQRLLKLAKAHVAKIPFDHLDLLIVDEIGKTISGTGMDLNVIGKWRATGKGDHTPEFHRIAALSLTKPSLGNGLGIGLADFTTERFMKAYDPAVSYINLLTATEPGGTTREGPIPLALPSDREAIEVALYTSLAGPNPRVCRIRNTGRLDEIWVSEALLSEARANETLSLDSAPEPLPYDGAGNLF